MTTSEDLVKSGSEEAIRFLGQDFAQCFAHMRHYDQQILDICKFMFGGYTALLGVGVGLYRFFVDRGVDLTVPVGLALFVGLIVGLILLGLSVRNRVYFVMVARYVNEQRGLFLQYKPLGFENVTGMYTDPSDPPFFNWKSSQSWLIYLISLLNSVVMAALAFTVIPSSGYRLWVVGLSAILLLIVQVSTAVSYLSSRDKKKAEEAVFGRRD